MKQTLLLVAMLAAIPLLVKAQRKGDGRTLRHVVFFKFKDSASAADVKKVEEAFRSLPSKIRTITAFEWGTNTSPDGLSHGFTHCFLVSFRSGNDRDAYLPHPAHQAFVDVLKPHLDKVMVLDYWAEN